ncbi:putative porin [Adhaeribacter terreus]|uniref:Porin n=1 Tax=Adhaeribacter terreus TaxID=529703 RepID=A0ABW0EAB9_9BACT
MNFKKKAFLLALAAFGFYLPATAQITNDSTVQLYGPETTRVLFENKFFRGNYEDIPVDTSLTNFASSFYWFSDTTFQQTLGNFGLATKPLLFQLPTRIGVRLGRNEFDYYAYKLENLTYFDTRSPYTKLYYLQGSLGEGLFEGEFSRNIKPWWSAGIAYHRVTANKQIGAVQRKDSQVDHNGVKVYTHLQTTNNRYHLFAHYLHTNHEFVETGGVRVTETDTTRAVFFNFPSQNVNLTQATGRDIRHSFHVGQTYALFGEHLKLFYHLDERRQMNRFDDAGLAFDSIGGNNVLFFHPNKINYSAYETHDRSIYSELENTAGITGNQKHYYYKAYLKNRNAKVTGLTRETQRFNQTFIGGEAEGKVTERIKGAFKGEYKLTDEYFAQGELRFLFLGARQTRMQYAPTLMQQTYFGNHHDWQNNFENISADRTAVWIEGELWNNWLHLELANTALRNYVFFNQQQQPEQVSASQQFQTVTLNHRLAIGKLHWDNLAVYTNINKGDKIRMPELIANSKLYYQGFIFKRALFGQIGVETTYRTGYSADAYSPSLQQFYLEDEVNSPLYPKVESYPVIDVFLAADVKSLNVFLKLAHANEGLNGDGYFTTPYYPGMRRSFIFGVKWMFFD